ncbi:MAG: peptide chain release factor N(5)-glutamine methyltransferase [Chlorobi bacterium]|nr:peptide chain release factor N(5)-glutamine methyltransferase [Chlorobiota bacterium]
MQVSSNKIKDIRRYYKRQLAGLYEENEIDSFFYILFEEYAGLSKAQILLNAETTISESELLKIHFAVKALMNHKPIQYIIGSSEFYGLKFKVSPDVLIPRPETEELTELVIKENSGKKDLSIMDIGTGSGCIAITLKKYLPDAKVHALDVSTNTLSLAKENAKLNGQEIEFLKMDFLKYSNWDKLNAYDIIVSNPPYVRKSEMKGMNKNVLDYEPAIALFVEDEKPLLFYGAIAKFANGHLNKSGAVYCEINQYLGEETLSLFVKSGFEQAEVFKDINGNDRILKVKLK